MGIVHIDHNNIYDSIVYILEKTEIESFSQKMREMEDVLKTAEELRFNYSNFFGQMIYETGSIVLREPNLRKSLKGLLYQISRDYDFEPPVFSFKNTPPFIEFNSQTQINPQVQTTYSTIVTFLEYCNNLAKNIDLCYNNCKMILKRFNEDYRKWEDEHYTFYKKDKVKIRNYHDIAERNIYKIKYSLDVLEYIKKKIPVIYLEGNEFYQISQNDRLKARERERMTRIRDNYLKAENKQLFLDNRVLYYMYTESDKYKDTDDWKKIYFSKIRNNKNYNVPENEYNENIELKKKIYPEGLNIYANQEEILNKKIDELNAKNIDLEKKQYLYKSQLESKQIIYIYKVYPLRNTNLQLNFSLKISGTSYPKCISIDNDNRLIMAGMKNGEVIFVDFDSQKIIYSLKNHANTVSSVCYMNNGRTFLSGGKDGVLAIIDISKQSENVTKYVIDSETKITSIVNPLNGDKFYLSCGNKIICMDFMTYNEIKDDSILLDEEIKKLEFIREENSIVIILKSGSIKIINLFNKLVTYEINENKDKINDFCLIKIDGINYIAFCTVNNVLNLYNLKEKIVEKQFKFEGEQMLKRILNCNDNKYILCVFSNGRISFKNLKDEKMKDINKEEKSEIKCCAYFGDTSNFVFGNVSGIFEFYHTKL